MNETPKLSQQKSVTAAAGGDHQPGAQRKRPHPLTPYPQGFHPNRYPTPHPFVSKVKKPPPSFHGYSPETPRGGDQLEAKKQRSMPKSLQFDVTLSATESFITPAINGTPTNDDKGLNITEATQSATPEEMEEYLKLEINRSIDGFLQRMINDIEELRGNLLNELSGYFQHFARGMNNDEVIGDNLEKDLGLDNDVLIEEEEEEKNDINVEEEDGEKDAEEEEASTALVDEELSLNP